MIRSLHIPPHTYVPLPASTGRCAAHEQAAWRVSLLRQPRHHPQRRSQEKTRGRSALALASCKRLLTPGPAALRNKTYPIRLVLQALTLYNLGYTLGETAKRLKSKACRAVSPTTIATWIGSKKRTRRSAVFAPKRQRSIR